MRVALGVFACLSALPVLADGPWRVVAESGSESVLIDFGSLQRSAGQVSFRERRIVRDGQAHSGSLRPVRDVLAKRLADCRGRRIATLSRAVFSDNDALIDHQATRPHQAVWQPVPSADPLFEQVCGSSAAHPTRAGPVELGGDSTDASGKVGGNLAEWAQTH